MTQNKIISELVERFKEGIIEIKNNYAIDYLRVKKDYVKHIIKFLKESSFEFLMDLSAVDYLGYPQKENTERFEVVYNLYSLSRNERIIVKAPVSENESNIESISDLFDAANWYEREVYDMFGIYFKNHPDLRRILMYDEFEGYPLRKDYPFNKKQPRIKMKEAEK
ncbi:MAG: NADH-quinone oxidoreductase subunit C [Elusimicrobiales bacterium]